MTMSGCPLATAALIVQIGTGLLITFAAALAAAICAAAVAVFVVGWMFVRLEPEAAITRAEAAAGANLATISPFELMTRRGRNLPVEDWRDAF